MSLSQAAVLPLNVGTYKSALYDRLGTMIAELELLPGARLVETEMADAFRVSKTPIREALLLLEAEGLVRLQPHQGATVTRLSMAEFEELLFIQDSLEQTALPLVIGRITDEDIGRIQIDIDRAVTARQQGDSRGCFLAGIAVHQALFGVLAFGHMSRILSGILVRPIRRYERALVHPLPAAWDAELQVLTGRFEHVRRRDPEGARRVVQEGRARMLELARVRAEDAEVATYF
jgi:DNA-binding GntR family transcriptional regulator